MGALKKSSSVSSSVEDELVRYLGTHPLFACWKDPWLKELSSFCQLTLMKPGDVLFLGGEPLEGLWIPLDGRWTLSGEDLPLPAVLGEESLYELRTSPGLLKAESQALILFINSTRMYQFFRGCPEALARWGGVPETVRRLTRQILQASQVQRRMPLDQNERVEMIIRPAPFHFSAAGFLFLGLSFLLPGLLFNYLAGLGGVVLPGVLSSWNPWVTAAGLAGCLHLLLLLLTLFFPLAYNKTFLAVTDRALLFRRLTYVPFSREILRIPLEELEVLRQGVSSLGQRLLGLSYLEAASAGEDAGFRMNFVSPRASFADRLEPLREQRQAYVEARRRMRIREMMSLKEPAAEEAAVLKQPGSVTYRKSWWVLAGKLFFPFLLIAGFLGVRMAVLSLAPAPSGVAEMVHRLLPVLFPVMLLPLLWALWRVEDWRNDLFLCRGSLVIDWDKKPLGLQEQRSEMRLEDVQSITTRQKGLLKNILGFGDVVIESSSAGEPLVFEDVASPWEIQADLFRRREQLIRSRDDARRISREKELTEIFRVYEEMKSSDT